VRADVERLVTDALVTSYGVCPVEVSEIPAGTATVNFRVQDDDGRLWFAKVYRDRHALGSERAAVELAEFARSGGLPVPEVRQTLDGALIDEQVPMSLWEYVDDAETAECGITDRRWPAIGAVVGRLHRRLAEHPAARPELRTAVGVRDVRRAHQTFARVIAEYEARTGLSSFEEWALEAAKERRALIDRAGAVLAGLPELTVQVVHGDLAAPNLMLRGNEVAALIDFQSPAPRFSSWEVGRIGCDPRTVMRGDGWIGGLAELLAAYWDEHPAARVEDLVSTVAVGCAYAVASSYPLAEPLDDPGAVTPSLETYARARHESALLMLERLDEVQEILRHHLS
jgi:Ser/Thr protein kinase RdoA (MazF antagonist)